MLPLIYMALAKTHIERCIMAPTLPPPLSSEFTEDKNIADAVVIITVNGDLILQIQDTSERAAICYRVSSTVLKGVSAYFVNLLDPQKFSEGVRVHTELIELRTKYSDFSTVPASSLPRISISDVGDFPEGISNEFILTYFFKILHRTHERPHRVHPNASSMALLSVVADRFGAAKSVSSYVKEIKTPHSLTMKEEAWRQKLLTGYLLGIDDFVKRWSSQLILAGSERWIQDNEKAIVHGEPLWWHLPSDVEGMSAQTKKAQMADVIRGACIPSRMYIVNYKLFTAPFSRLVYL